MDFLTALQKRNLLQDCTPELEQALTQPLKGYIGFDPTAPSLHIGNWATLMLLRRFQKYGHQPVIVLGGATGMIGDPSFKKQERKFLEEEQLRAHQKCLFKQFQQFFDFSSPHGALFFNNYDWYKDFSMLSFLRKVGKHISINYMMGKESVKNRMEEGISYTEFAYQLLQAYDFYFLYKNHGVHLQMGGSDQWGNLTSGIELIRKKERKAAHALTTPLITKSDGTKFGKTEQGNIWLDPQMTSPYQFYQFWLNCSDEESPQLLKSMTLTPLEEIETWCQTHKQAPHLRFLQKKLAQLVTTQVHSLATYEKVTHASEVLFGNAPVEALLQLEESLLLDVLGHLPKVKITASTLANTTTLTDLLTVATDHVVFKSKREARDIIQAGGLRINKVKQSDPQVLPTLTWLHNRYLLLQKGKKKYFLLEKAL